MTRWRPSATRLPLSVFIMLRAVVRVLTFARCELPVAVMTRAYFVFCLVKCTAICKFDGTMFSSVPLLPASKGWPTSTKRFGFFFFALKKKLVQQVGRT